MSTSTNIADEEDWSDLDEAEIIKIDESINEHDGTSGQELKNYLSNKDFQKSEQQVLNLVNGSSTKILSSKRGVCEQAPPPLIQFCRSRYLCVTDITQQLWCEQQLQYRMMGVEPGLTDMQEIEAGDVPLSVKDKEEVKKGKSLHYARELETHDVVDVKISSNTDKWALNILNLLVAMRGFFSGIAKAREVPIFGDLGTSDMLFGIIDELHFDEKTYSLHLVELKTRKSTRLPGVAQAKQNTLQVQIYKRLWDNLVKGNMSADFFLNKLCLEDSADLSLSEEIIQHMDQLPMSTFSLRNIFSLLLSTAQSLVCIGSMSIEYVHQETHDLIGHVEVKEEEDWMWQIVQHSLEFWHGQRECEGVEVEEAWKCGMCEYGNICEWRRNKISSHLQNPVLLRVTRTKLKTKPHITSGQ